MKEKIEFDLDLYNTGKYDVVTREDGPVEIKFTGGLCNRLVERAFACMDDKQVCKLRRGIKVTFYYA